MNQEALQTIVITTIAVVEDLHRNRIRDLLLIIAAVHPVTLREVDQVTLPEAVEVIRVAVAEVAPVVARAAVAAEEAVVNR